MKRVVITGAGTINALGQDVPATLEAMREGRCGIGELEFRDVERLAIRIGGQVKGFEPETVFNRQQLALYDRFTQFTLLAARQAVAQAGLEFVGDLANTSGVVLANVPAGRVMLGYPAMKMETHIEAYKGLRRLPRLFRDVAELKKAVSKLMGND